MADVYVELHTAPGDSICFLVDPPPVSIQDVDDRSTFLVSGHDQTEKALCRVREDHR